jgi:hypothetical protein
MDKKEIEEFCKILMDESEIAFSILNKNVMKTQ